MNSYELKEALNKLKLDLSVRSTNQHCGSKLGGNSSEYFFLLNHEIFLESSIDDKSHFNIFDNKKTVFAVPKRFDLKQAREALTECFKVHPDKKDVSFEQLTSPSFLVENGSGNLEIKLLILALLNATILAKSLKPKVVLLENIHSFFVEERTALEADFCQNIGIPKNYLAGDDILDDNPVLRMFETHPVWGPKLKAVQKREKEITFSLVSQEELDKFNFIGTFPPHIALLAVRSIIEINTIVSLLLDERAEFMDKINKSF